MPLFRMPCIALMIALVTLSWDRARGEDAPPLVTDRPDQTESAAAVPAGMVQVEVGWSRTHNDDDGVEEITDELTTTLVRIGLVDRVELRLGFAGFIDAEVDTGPTRSSEAGAGDTSIGGKLELWNEDDWLPAAAVLAELSLPTGSVSSERVDPAARLSLAHTLSDRLSLGYNAGIAWESEEDAAGDRSTLSSAFYTVALGAALDDRTGAFFELFGDVGLSRDGGPRHSIDGGFTFLLEPDLQLDLSGGFGLSEDADDWFLAVGVSYRGRARPRR